MKIAIKKFVFQQKRKEIFMETSFAYQILALKKEFTMFCNEKLQEMGLSIGLMFFVVYIGKHSHCSPGELSQAIRMDTGHTTRSIDKLVKSGFVEKERSKVDKRSQELVLTEKGIEVFHKIYTLFEQWEQIKLKDFSKEERELLDSLLNRLVQKGESACTIQYKRK